MSQFKGFNFSIRGSAKIKLSKNSKRFLFRKVTLQPESIPRRNFQAKISFVEIVATHF